MDNGNNGRVFAAYDALLAAGALQPDPVQADAVALLDDLADGLREYRPARVSLFSFWQSAGAQTASPAGIYLHGGVGRGKTMLMDLFFEAVQGPPKRRLHFHEFMGEAHERIRRGRATSEGDPIPQVAAEMAAEALVLCLDELMVTDIADAMIIGRLFRALFGRGVVLVVTSNSAPERLYWNGLNRQLFLPFLELLQAHTRVVELASERDYRLERLSGQELFFSPLDQTAKEAMDAHWERLTAGYRVEAATLDVKGRPLMVPRAGGGVARFSFLELCQTALGAADYLALARAYHTVLVDGIPQLSPEQRNEARRFIHFIDALYDEGVCLIASAATTPDELYLKGDGSDLFARTSSRLMEMRSVDFVADRRSHRVFAVKSDVDSGPS